jgi:hypothetical protein
MGTPDRTVDPNGKEEDDVYMTIEEAARKANMTDMDIFVAWGMGFAAYQQARNMGVKFPHDEPEQEEENLYLLHGEELERTVP